MKGKSPIHADHTIERDFFLVLIPKEVDGQPLSLNHLGELVQDPKSGEHATSLSFYNLNREAHGNTSVGASYWALVSKEVLPSSRDNLPSVQKAIVKELGEGWRIPKCVEAASTAFLQHAKSGERILGNSPLTYTGCSEERGGRPIIVGGFDPDGLHVPGYNFLADERVGVLAVRSL